MSLATGFAASAILKLSPEKKPTLSTILSLQCLCFGMSLISTATNDIDIESECLRVVAVGSDLPHRVHLCAATFHIANGVNVANVSPVGPLSGFLLLDPCRISW